MTHYPQFKGFNPAAAVAGRNLPEEEDNKYLSFSELKNVKKVIDDKDRARKASVLSEVAETAKVSVL
jgi:hypothetical protein